MMQTQTPYAATDLRGTKKAKHPLRRGRASAAAALSLLMIVLAGGIVSAPAASAASNGGVYIVAPKSWGWCPNIRGINNRPIYMHAVNNTSGDSRADSGDDIIWVGVRLNQSNRVAVNVGCSLGHGSTGTVVNITPRRNGQSFFVSPSGYAWGN